MTKETFRSYIREAKFRDLFNSLGWNNYRGYADFDQVIDGVTFAFKVVAEYPGYQVIICETEENITTSFCKRLDYKIRPQAQNYILIFKLPGECHHIWVVPVKKTEKRDLVLVEYHSLDQTDFLFSKLDQLTFPLGTTMNVVDVLAQVQGCFEVNSEKITKDFYTGFQKQHTAFCKFISGIDDHIEDGKNKNKQWYTSVMLNRLMFCYFIQKKGFLDGNKNYLQNKLSWCQMMQGSDKFYSFYKSFLLQLFFDGINKPLHSDEFTNEFGRIPYLNGGMFDQHQLEKDYSNIDIKDEAFKQLFDFFDKWEWHLDTRVTASGRDINPDVLGYIFEQYINDRAQMGAYYTKEDITEYIGKNCILPFLMDRLKETDSEAFKPNGYVWKTLQESGSTYIYDAVKKGVDHFDEIPQDIADGIDTTQPNLLDRRAHWNDKTPDTWALPTEIWRESIERMQRCQDIQQKIANGEIHEINDFITYNLDIRQFVQNLLEKTDDHKMILHFNQALTKVTILDPTCGSGAFLFAAMNILEPLYEVCINRMRDFHDQNPNYFKRELEELDGRYKSNVQYFIYKTIILHNLYGVDIMHEAVEIAKLRLFLKMVAVVDVDMRADNLGLDPLPDIDFNIRCGNTLVGYATEEQLNNDLSFGDMFANLEFKEKIESEMDKVAHTFDSFRALQLSQDASDMQAFKTAKMELNERLSKLNELLNRKLYMATSAMCLNYDYWYETRQPFHWLAEYYQIIHGNGGFDIIIGNPPYVEWTKSELLAINQPIQVVESGNLYSAVIYRCLDIINIRSHFGMIIPISFISTQQHKAVRKAMEHRGTSYYSSYDIRPDHLFDGAAQRLTIFINSPLNNDIKYTDRQLRWYTVYRPCLFQTIQYSAVVEINDSFYRSVGCSDKIIRKITNRRQYISSYSCNGWVATTANNYIKAIEHQPYYTSNGSPKKPSGWRELSFPYNNISTVSSVINSSLFYFIWKASSDGFNLTQKFIVTLLPYLIDDKLDLRKEGKALLDGLESTSRNYIRNQRTTGVTEIQLFEVKPNKVLIDEIDKVLAKHYGFTEEELDFIINYDIKYRMGDELSEE